MVHPKFLKKGEFLQREGDIARYGAFVVQGFLRSYVMDNSRLVPEEEKEIDGVRYRLTRWADETHFFKSIEIHDGQPGLPLTFCGDYSLAEYDSKTSPRTILIAQKIS